MASNLLDFMVSGYHLLMFTADRSAAARIVGIRINVSLRQPKLHLNDVPVKITGVYRHIFQVEEDSSWQPKRHALQYADVLTHDIELLDL